MRGIQDPPDPETEPIAVIRPKRLAASLLLLALLVLPASAGIQDSPDGVDPLGAAPVACTMEADTIAATFVEPVDPFATEFGRCDGKQQADCAAKCDAAAPSGHVTRDSKCEHHIIPWVRGFVAYYSCACTWVPMPKR